MSHTTDTLSGLLVRRAARIAPSSLSARLEEEWLADLHERTSASSRLAFALGCFWASAAIGREHRLTVPVASAAQGDAVTLVQSPRFLSSRAVTFGLVLSVHVAVFYGLMLGHTRLVKPADTAPLQPRMIDLPQPKVLPPRPGIDMHVIPDLRPPRIIDPPPDTKVPANTVVSTPVLDYPSAPPTERLPPREVVHLQGGTGPGFPHPDEYYPDVARRQEEQGATVLQVCVDAGGRLTRDPVSTQSSGSARLDAAAIKLAKAGSGHYRPSTDDGRPVNSCYPLRIRFQLRN